MTNAKALAPRRDTMSLDFNTEGSVGAEEATKPIIPNTELVPNAAAEREPIMKWTSTPSTAANLLVVARILHELEPLRP